MHEVNRQNKDIIDDLFGTVALIGENVTFSALQLDIAMTRARQEGIFIRDEGTTPRRNTVGADAVSLRNCPPGPFLFDGTLGFKSEYGATLPVDPVNVPGDQVRWKVSDYPDAYCMDSGEFFWAGAKTHDARAELLVTPIDVQQVDTTEYKVGTLTMQRVFAAANLKNMSDMPAVLDAMERALEPSKEARKGDPVYWLLRVLDGMGGTADASDSKYCWLNAFCDDKVTTDTFNYADQKGYIWVGHDTDNDYSTAHLTDAGRAYIADVPDSIDTQVVRELTQWMVEQDLLEKDEELAPADVRATIEDYGFIHGIEMTVNDLRRIVDLAVAWGADQPQYQDPVFADRLINAAKDEQDLEKVFLQFNLHRTETDRAAQPQLLEALDWAMAELRGKTRYDNPQQRLNCFEKADAAIRKATDAAIDGATQPTPQAFDRQQWEEAQHALAWLESCAGDSKVAGDAGAEAVKVRSLLNACRPGAGAPAAPTLPDTSVVDSFAAIKAVAKDLGWKVEEDDAFKVIESALNITDVPAGCTVEVEAGVSTWRYQIGEGAMNVARGGFASREAALSELRNVLAYPWPKPTPLLDRPIAYTTELHLNEVRDGREGTIWARHFNHHQFPWEPDHIPLFGHPDRSKWRVGIEVGEWVPTEQQLVAGLEAIDPLNGLIDWNPEKQPVGLYTGLTRQDLMDGIRAMQKLPATTLAPQLPAEFPSLRFLEAMRDAKGVEWGQEAITNSLRKAFDIVLRDMPNELKLRIPAPQSDCRACKGEGAVPGYVEGLDGGMMCVPESCGVCNGNGKTPSPKPDVTGELVEAEAIEVIAKAFFEDFWPNDQWDSSADGYHYRRFRSGATKALALLSRARGE